MATPLAELRDVRHVFPGSAGGETHVALENMTAAIDPGVITGVIALAAGTLGAWLVVKYVFDVGLVFDAGAALFTVIGGGAATLLFGLVAAWAALSAKPAALLRAP